VFIKNIDDCAKFTANDGCQIQEWLHPENDKIDLPYSVAIATVAVGQRSYKHKLEQAEVYLITAGRGLMHIDDEVREVTAGEAIYIEPTRTQWIENVSGEVLQFTAIVSPPWSEEGDIRL
jgi:mannose-6-phosphate isomerase-like protein (cupin superfamily)